MKNKLRLVAAIVLTGLALPLLASFTHNITNPEILKAAAGEESYQSYLGYEEDARTYDFNNDWQFYEAKSDTEDYSQNSVDNLKLWKDVTLPHDIDHDKDYTYNGEGESGYFESSYGWYRKTFVIPANLAEKKVSLQFDGSYMITDVYLNGTKLGSHYNGYAAFAFDLTGLINKDGSPNILTIKVKNEIPSSRWYSGSGLFRDVKLRITDRLHFAYQGVRHSTPNLGLKLDEGYGLVKTDFDLTNSNNAEAKFKVKTTIYDKAGTSVGTTTSDTITLQANSTRSINLETRVDAPHLWSTLDPYRYSVTSEIVSEDGATVYDETQTRLGFKYTNWNSDKGFFLNGEFLELHGVALHHDMGPVGAANFYDAQYRQILKMKEMGVNAIRTSHNPPSQNFLDICDDLGILVIAEAFDGFTAYRDSNWNDYARFFPKTIDQGSKIENGDPNMTWAEYDLKSMVKKAMNHPSVFALSIGNEVFQAAAFNDPDVPADINKFDVIASSLVRWIRSIDADKHITMGENQDKGATNNNSNAGKVRQVLYKNNGAFGINYAGGGTYNSAHRNQPNLPIYESEGASAIATRAYYKTLTQDNTAKLVTGYDSHHVDWGTSADTAILTAAERDFVAGTFIWTGWDYIGEPTPWNITNSFGWNGVDPKSSSFGIVDTAGFPKDPYYKYQAQWRKDGKTTLQILPSWNREDIIIDASGNVRVDVYTNAAKVDLVLNGKTIKTGFMNKNVTPMGNVYYTQSGSDNTPKGKDGWNNYLELSFNVPYEAGELKAVAYDELGNVIPDSLIEGRTSVKTTTAAKTIVLNADKTETLADGSSLVYVDTTVLDEDGDLVENAQNDIHYEVSGPGVLEGTDNGRPTDFRQFKSPDRQLWAGKGVAVIRTTEDPGQITLTATSAGLTQASVTIESKPRESSYLKVKTSKDYWFKKGDEVFLDDKASIYKSGALVGEYNIAWTSLPNKDQAGSHTVSGTVSYDGLVIPVTATVHIASSGFVAATNISLMAVKGQYPTLPNQVDGIKEDGTIGEALPVTWDAYDFGQAQAGQTVTINGTATSRYDNTTFPVTASIRIADGASPHVDVPNDQVENVVATPAATTGKWDKLFDGYYTGGAQGYDPNNQTVRMTLPKGADGKAQLDFTFKTPQQINTVNMWFVKDKIASEGVTFEYQSEGSSEWKTYGMATYLIQSEDAGVTSFGNALETITAKTLRIRFTPANNTDVALSEISFSKQESLTQNESTDIQATLGNNPITFDANRKATVSLNGLKPEDLKVAPTTAAVTIVPLQGKSIIWVISEDGLNQVSYEITWQ